VHHGGRRTPIYRNDGTQDLNGNQVRPLNLSPGFGMIGYQASWTPRGVPSAAMRASIPRTKPTVPYRAQGRCFVHIIQSIHEFPSGSRRRSWVSAHATAPGWTSVSDVPRPSSCNRRLVPRTLKGNDGQVAWFLMAAYGARQATARTHRASENRYPTIPIDTFRTTDVHHGYGCKPNLVQQHTVKHVPHAADGAREADFRLLGGADENERLARIRCRLQRCSQVLSLHRYSTASINIRKRLVLDEHPSPCC